MATERVVGLFEDPIYTLTRSVILGLHVTFVIVSAYEVSQLGSRNRQFHLEARAFPDHAELDLAGVIESNKWKLREFKSGGRINAGKWYQRCCLAFGGCLV
jgi:hypothetical protein